MPEKIDQKTAVARIESVLGVEYEVIGSYINNKSRITLKHNVCGKEYSPTYKDVVAGKSRCVHCYNPKSILISHEEWLKEVATLVGKEYSVLGEFKRATAKVLMKHNTCGREFEMAPKYFRRGRRCPKCGGTAKKSHEEFVDEVKKLVGDEYRVIGAYVNDATKISLEHSKCKSIYEVTPSHFIQGKRCPACRWGRNSKGVKEITRLLQKFEIPFEIEKSFNGLQSDNGRPLRYDFFLFEHNILIEFDGEGHFVEKTVTVNSNMFKPNIETIKKHDKRKNDYADKNGLSLVRFNYLHLHKIEHLFESAFFNIEESSETIEKEKVYVSGSGVGDFCKRSYYTRANKDYFTE